MSDGELDASPGPGSLLSGLSSQLRWPLISTRRAASEKDLARLGAAGLSRRSLMGSFMLWTCLILTLMVAVSLLFPFKPEEPNIIRMRARTMKEQSAEDIPQELHPTAMSATKPVVTPAEAISEAVAGSTQEQGSRAETLVIYTYSKSDPEYERNLIFFIQHGMWEHDGCEYLIIVQQGNGLFEAGELPQLPANARYTYHENKCYDWGTFGWAMETGKVDTSKYKYIIFMNSSVRGPFLPPYWPETVHWSNILTSKLNAKVKLVGATISCERCWMGGNTANAMRHNPHVQSYFMATDQVGMEVLKSDGNVFNCYESMWDTIYHSEVGSSRAVLNAGYTLDSLMLRYQGVDWHNQSNWQCNGELNPYAEYAYDGITLNPMEVIFPKVKGFTIEGEWTTPRMAATYDRWMTHKGEVGAANSNDYKGPNRSSYRLGKMLTMAKRGCRCFDFAFYTAKSHDLPAGWPNDQLWSHFVHDGQFEGRPFRFTCSTPFRGEKDEVEAAIAAAMMPGAVSVDDAIGQVALKKAKDSEQASKQKNEQDAAAAAKQAAEQEAAAKKLAEEKERLQKATEAASAAADKTSAAVSDMRPGNATDQR